MIAARSNFTAASMSGEVMGAVSTAGCAAAGGFVPDVGGFSLVSAEA